jgi:hypothetical protein
MQGIEIGTLVVISLMREGQFAQAR